LKSRKKNGAAERLFQRVLCCPLSMKEGGGALGFWGKRGKSTKTDQGKDQNNLTKIIFIF